MGGRHIVRFQLEGDNDTAVNRLVGLQIEEKVPHLPKGNFISQCGVCGLVGALLAFILLHPLVSGFPYTNTLKSILIVIFREGQ